eukprot:1716591-Prymnesium_polylepis.1
MLCGQHSGPRGRRVTGEKITFKGFYGVVCSMVYLENNSRHQKAPFKGVARKSLVPTIVA